MNNGNEVYEKIAAMWRLPGSQKLIRILKNGFTPEEGEIILGLSTFTTCEQLAKKLNKDQAYVQSILDGLGRGWVRGLKGYYINIPNMIAIIPHSTMPGVSPEERRAQWLDWFRTDEYQKWQLESWVRQSKVLGGYAVHRILPAHRALAASPRIKPEQILWYEDMPEVFKRTKKIQVGPCGCRSVWGICDSPMVTCIGVTYTDPVGPPRQGPHLSPSRFRAVIGREACSGCQTCIERCHFSAIEMQNMPGAKKLKATMVNEKCMGCGLCVIKCPQNAITLELIRPPEHIPTETTDMLEEKRLTLPDWLGAPA